MNMLKKERVRYVVLVLLSAWQDGHEVRVKGRCKESPLSHLDHVAPLTLQLQFAFYRCT